MRDTLIGILMGIAFGAAMTAAVVHVKEVPEHNDIVTSRIKIIADGREINPVDADGIRVDSFIYNNIAYLPVSAVAMALDKTVYIDEENSTVYLGNMNGMLENPTVRLKDMVNIGDSIMPADRLTDNYGNRYTHAVYNHIAYTHEYLLNMKYSRFKGILYVPEGEKNDETVTFSIWGDGEIIYTSPEMSKTSEPVAVDVDISGCNDIKMTFSDARHKLVLCLAEAGFYQ